VKRGGANSGRGGGSPGREGFVGGLGWRLGSSSLRLMVGGSHFLVCAGKWGDVIDGLHLASVGGGSIMLGVYAWGVEGTGPGGGQKRGPGPGGMEEITGIIDKSLS